MNAESTPLTLDRITTSKDSPFDIVSVEGGSGDKFYPIPFGKVVDAHAAAIIGNTVVTQRTDDGDLTIASPLVPEELAGEHAIVAKAPEELRAVTRLSNDFYSPSVTVSKKDEQPSSLPEHDQEVPRVPDYLVGKFHNPLFPRPSTVVELPE